MAKVNVVQRNCPECRFAIQYVVGDRLTGCPRCGIAITKDSDGGEKAVTLDGRERRILPFKTTVYQFRDGFLRYLAEGEYTPNEVFDGVRPRVYLGLYAAVYVYGGQARVTWSAMGGHAREETYTETELVNEGGRRVERKVERSREMIDWKAETGSFEQPYRVAALATSGLPEVAAELLEDLEGLPPMASIPTFEEDALRGYTLEPFLGSPEKRFVARADPQLKRLLDTEVRGRVPGKQCRDVSFKRAKIQESVTRLYRPVWVAVYEYAGRAYVFAMDGHTGRRVGTRPEDAELRGGLDRHRWRITLATIVAVVAAVLSFPLLPFFGALAIATLWFIYTERQRLALRVFEHRMSMLQRRKNRVIEGLAKGVAQL